VLRCGRSCRRGSGRNRRGRRDPGGAWPSGEVSGFPLSEISAGVRFTWGQCPGQGNDADVDAFYGIVIQMFWLDHPPPHFHALYAEHEALIDIRILEVIEGNLPRRALALTLEWAREHRDELMEDWNLCRQRQSPKTIEPLR
jgi:Domain of unknown function (DUF4160)